MKVRMEYMDEIGDVHHEIWFVDMDWFVRDLGSLLRDGNTLLGVSHMP